MLTIITGLTSLGKSIMLETLKTRGIKILNEHISNIDKGVTTDLLENEKIEQIAERSVWFKEGENWAVSLVSVLLRQLPLQYNYNVIFIERNIDDIIKNNENIFSNIITSNEDMIQERLKKTFIEIHADRVKNWLNQNPNFNTVVVDYNSVMEKPMKIITEINKKLNLNFNIEENLTAVESNKI